MNYKVFETLESWYQQLMSLAPYQMKRIARMGGKVRRLVALMMMIAQRNVERLAGGL